MLGSFPLLDWNSIFALARDRTLSRVLMKVAFEEGHSDSSDVEEVEGVYWPNGKLLRLGMKCQKQQFTKENNKCLTIGLIHAFIYCI